MMYICAWHAAAFPPRVVNLFENDGSFRNAETRAAVFLGNQRSHIPGMRQGLDEGLGIGALLVQLAPIFVGKFAAQFAYGGFQFFVRFIHRAVHWIQRKTSSSGRALA